MVGCRAHRARSGSRKVPIVLNVSVANEIPGDQRAGSSRADVATFCQTAGKLPAVSSSVRRNRQAMDGFLCGGAALSKPESMVRARDSTMGDWEPTR